MALVTPSEVRTGRLEAASAAGAVADDQLTEAIKDASLRMKALVSDDLYEEVEEGPDDDRKQDFKEAECRFAVAELVPKLSGVQLAKTGLLRRREVGKSTTEFASAEEVKKIRGEWEASAIRWLANHLATDIKDSDNESIGVVTKDRKLRLVAIGSNN